MKIAFIGQKGIPVFTGGGGVERRVEELSTRMSQRGHQVTVYARADYIINTPRRYKGVNLIYCSFIPTKNLSAISHTFVSTINALFQDYDVIHYQSPGPSTLCWIIKIFKRKTTLIATFNSLDFKHQKWGFFAKKYLKFGEWVITKVPDKTIVISEILEKYVKKRFQKDTIMIHNGASVEEDVSHAGEELNKWCLYRKRYFLTVVRLVQHKGIHYLIKAFQDGQKDNRIPKDFKLVIVGDSSYTDDYVKYLKKLGHGDPNVIFTGTQTGKMLSQLYFHSYALVHPSEAEGLSNAILEAMGYGITPIVSDIEENLLPVDGYGIVFKNKSISDLKSKLIYAIENDKLIEDLGKKAKQHVLKHYCWEENTLQTLMIYHQVFMQKRKGQVLI